MNSLSRYCLKIYNSMVIAVILERPQHQMVCLGKGIIGNDREQMLTPCELILVKSNIFLKCQIEYYFANEYLRK